MKIEVHESALDSIKAMGQLVGDGKTPSRDICQIAADVMVNPYSTAIIEKAE